MISGSKGVHTWHRGVPGVWDVSTQENGRALGLAPRKQPDQAAQGPRASVSREYEHSWVMKAREQTRLAVRGGVTGE